MVKDKIFISHRHDDTESESLRLKDELQKIFGHEKVFLDFKNIDPGENFKTKINKSLSESRVVLVVIGPNWDGGITSSGKSRLFDNHDWVRREVAEALKDSANTVVIPILMKNAAVVQPENLPEDLAELADLQVLEISNKRWDYDVNVLVKELEKYVRRESSSEIKKPILHKPKPKSWLERNYLWVLGGVVALFVIIGLAGTEPTPYPIDDNIEEDEKGKDTVDIDPVKPQIKEDLKKNNPPATNQKAIIHDLSGSWVLQDNEGNQSTLIFTQNGNTFEFLEYNVFNNQIGKGSGVIDGNNWTADYYNTMFNIGGKLSMATSNSGSSWEGLVIVPEVASTQISLRRN